MNTQDAADMAPQARRTTTSAPTYHQVGNHLWAECQNCGRMVKVTGWARGLHVCKE